MHADLRNSSHLCTLIHELVEIASRYQGIENKNLQLHMHRSHNDDWDEIYVVSEDTATGKKWQVVKVAIAKLSHEERMKLDLHISMQNIEALHKKISTWI